MFQQKSSLVFKIKTYKLERLTEVDKSHRLQKFTYIMQTYSFSFWIKNL